jgi:CRISPR-associated protein Csm2
MPDNRQPPRPVGKGGARPPPHSARGERRDRERQRGGDPGGRRMSDDDRRQKIREVFGANYAEDILRPNKPDANAHIDLVQRFVKERGQITASQLRNIFSRLRGVRQPAELAVLRPQLAYVAGRADKEHLRELVVLLDDLIKKTDSTEKLGEFKSFLEAVVAYHKYFHPTKS